MSLTHEEKNWFYRRLLDLVNQSKELQQEAATAELEEFSHRYGTLVSYWKLINDHADRVGITLGDYRDDTKAITSSLQSVEKTLRQRKSNPFLYNILHPTLVIAEKIDNVLKALNIPPLLRPIGEAILGIFGWVSQRLLGPGQETMFLPTLGLASQKLPEVTIENVRVDQNALVNGVRGIGIYIRNQFGLWGSNLELLDDYFFDRPIPNDPSKIEFYLFRHPDTASGIPIFPPLLLIWLEQTMLYKQLFGLQEG